MCRPALALLIGPISVGTVALGCCRTANTRFHIFPYVWLWCRAPACDSGCILATVMASIMTFTPRPPQTSQGIVDKAADLDVATVMAMGFPPYRGGLIFWADLVGAKHIAAKLDECAKRFGPKHAGTPP